MKLIALLLVVVACAGLVEPHGVLVQPLARHAYFKNPQFPQNYPMYWDSQGVFCGNTPQDERFSQCGRCGDPAGQSQFNHGGEFGHSHVAANYTAGSTVEVQIEFQAAHYGSFQVEVCNSNIESDGCFQPLPMTGGSDEIKEGNRMCVPYDNTANRLVRANVRLPSGLRCTRCTLRWTYRTSYPVASLFIFLTWLDLT